MKKNPLIFQLGEFLLVIFRLESKTGFPGRCVMVALDFMAPQCSPGSPGPGHASVSWPSGRLECSWVGVSVNQTILGKKGSLSIH